MHPRLDDLRRARGVRLHLVAALAHPGQHLGVAERHGRHQAVGVIDVGVGEHRVDQAGPRPAGRCPDSTCMSECTTPAVPVGCSSAVASGAAVRLDADRRGFGASHGSLFHCVGRSWHEPETSDAARHRHHPPPDRRAGETFPPRRADTLCVRGASLCGCGTWISRGVRQTAAAPSPAASRVLSIRATSSTSGQVARGAQRLGPEGHAADGAEQRAVRGDQRDAEVGGDVASQPLRQRGVRRDGGRHGRHARRPALGHRPAEALLPRQLRAGADGRAG